jgi:beta-glucosidase
MITENGICDASDAKREKFIVDHLAQLGKAIEEGAEVTRYFHWSFLDNLEWNEGYGPRFGLVGIDYATMKRQPRASALAYADICRTHRVAAQGGNER